MLNASDTPNRSGPHDLVVLTLAALAARVSYLIAVRPVIDMPDAIHYITMARGFVDGNPWDFDENLPPLFPALGALAYFVFSDWEHAFWAASLVFSPLLVLPVYSLSMSLFGRETARLSAAMVCVWPWLVDYAVRIAPESVSVTLWFASIALTYGAITRGGASMLFAPLCLVGLHLARPEGTFIMIGAPFAALVFAWRQPRERVRRVVVFGALCAALLLTYAFAMRLLVGTFTVSYRAPMTEDIADYLSRGAVDGARTFMRLSFDVLPVMLGPVLLAFFGIGALSSQERGRNVRLELFILAFCAMQWALAVANFSPAPRYIMPVVVALSMWSARGAIIAGERLGAIRPWLRRIPAATVLAMFVVGAVAGVVPQFLGRMPSLAREYKLAGRWMQVNLEPGLVLCRKPQVGFYADMPSTGPAAEDGPEELIARAKEIGARYFVIDERYSAGTLPKLARLLDPAAAPPELRLLTDDLSPWSGAKIVVYEIVAPGIRYVLPDDAPPASSHMGPDERRRTDAN